MADDRRRGGVQGRVGRPTFDHDCRHRVGRHISFRALIGRGVHGGRQIGDDIGLFDGRILSRNNR